MKKFWDYIETHAWTHWVIALLLALAVFGGDNWQDAFWAWVD